MAGVNRNEGYFQPELECMTVEERDEFQLKKVRETATRACEKAAGTKKQFDEAVLDPAAISGIDDLKKLPLIRKREFSRIQKENPPFGGFNTVDITVLARIFTSPGPIYDPGGAEEDYWLLRKAFYAGGFRAGDIVQNTFSYHLTPAGMMCDRGLRGVGCVVVPTGVGNTEIQVNTMRDLSVTGYIGTPSYLLTIIQKAESMGLNFKKDFHLQMAYVAAEILPPSLRKKLQGYGLTVRQGYITADLGCVAYECPAEEGMHIPEEIVVEIVDPHTGRPKETGQVGEVVVTTLKESYPLFRFATGDLSRELEGECACGRTSKRLAGVLGRADEVTKVRGMFVHPGMIDEVLERAQEGLKGQGVVTRTADYKDVLTIRLVTDAEGEALERLASRVKELAREVLKVRAEVEKTTSEELGPWPKKIDDRRTWE